MSLYHAQLSGQEVTNGYAEITSAVAMTSTTPADVAGLTITITPLQALVFLRFWALRMDYTSTNAYAVQMVRDSTTIAVSTLQIPAGATSYRTPGVSMMARQSLTPGTSYTFKVQHFVGTNAQTGTLQAGATFPAFIQANYI